MAMKVEADGTLSTVPIVTVIWAVADDASARHAAAIIGETRKITLL